MRIRFKPYARPELAAWPQFIDYPTEYKGRWKEAFKEPSLPLYVELGCGKGGFIAQQAVRHPAYNYLGVDLKSEVLVVAKRTIEAAFAEEKRTLDNVVITSKNIEQILTMLAPEDAVRKIYINFCNPWSKSGHAKHRLTHPRQLIQYRNFLVPGGEICFKTDDNDLFNDSLRYFEYTGFTVTWLTRDLHAENRHDNVPTEHEKMFSEQGIPIKACTAKMHPAVLDKEAIARVKDI